MKYTKKQIESLLAGIYAGVITEYELPEDLYFAIADYLKKALYKGFGGALADFDGKDLELLTELRENVYMFSAAKTYQEVLEIKNLLYDEDGNFRSSKEFNQLGREKYDLWNDTYGQTEYNTCVGQAQQARQWNEIEKNKELFPYLKYVAVMDANTSDICAPLNDVVLPVDDPLWNSYSPLNHFNCRCVLEQLDKYEDVKETPQSQVDEVEKELKDKVQDAFKMNPGKDGYVFSPEHPYFDVADKDFAKQNFNLPIPPKD